MLKKEEHLQTICAKSETLFLANISQSPYAPQQIFKIENR
jgi:hypothetical protein